MTSDKPKKVDATDASSGSSPSRRRILKVALYTPPAIIGTLLISRDALAQVVSCNPQGCHPNGGPCGPDGCPPAG